MPRLHTPSCLVSLLVLAAGCAAPGEVAPAPREQGYLPVTDSLRLHYRVYGEGGETLVLLHGGPGATFMGVGPDLLSLAGQHTFVVYDQRGGGHSDPDPDAGSQTAAMHVADLETLRRHLDLQRMTLVGHSWGCTLAALYASRYPEHVERLLLIGPMEPTRELLTRRFMRQAALTESVADQLAALDPHYDVQQACRARLAIVQALYYHDPAKMALKRGDYCDSPIDFFWGTDTIGPAVIGSLGDYDLRPALASFDIPALVVEGAESPLPMEGEWAWARALPNGRLWLIDEVGHAYPFVEAPEVFFGGLDAFLAGGWPAGAVAVEP